MSDLRGWLRAQNLEQLAETFEANDIDIDILSELTDGDLEKLGVSIGNRRRLLKAISEGTAKSPESKAASTEALGAFAPSEATGAERRQVTVLFCDMVGSTALSEAVDPELLGALIRRYQDAAAGAIGRYGGFVAKFMGDGVLAYFGFPHAFEDAAERAVARSRVRMVPRCKRGSVSLPALLLSGKSSARVPRKSAQSLAKPPT